MDKKPIGAIIGDLISLLVCKEIITIDELKEIIGEAYFNELKMMEVEE